MDSAEDVPLIKFYYLAIAAALQPQHGRICEDWIFDVVKTEKLKTC